MRTLAAASLLSLFAAVSVGCGSNAADGSADADPNACSPSEDSDGDCMLNAVEGCGQLPEPDSDNDGMPDWFDADSDNDGLQDAIEAGDCADPRDTDGDGLPDYLEVDSDSDGVVDGFEDRDGNGVIGECTTTCDSTDDCDAEASEVCSLPMDGFGRGTCVSSTCAKGETNPHSPDTDHDGVLDPAEGTFICIPQSEDNPFGLKRIRYVDALQTPYEEANWKIALEVGALDGAPSLLNAKPLESAYIFDMNAPGVEVAGFLVSRAAEAESAIDERTWAIERIAAAQLVGSANIRVSGTNQTSLDGFDTVLGTRLLVRTGPNADVTALREEILPALLGRDPADVGVPDLPWEGQGDNEFVVVYQTVHRPEVGQTVFMGAVVRESDYQDRAKPSGFFADDMSNGTGLSVSENGEEIECEQYLADEQATADIIWIIDQSGSTSPYRAQIESNADTFFQKAIDVGLDFRMGVTDMNDTGPGGQPGIFATRDPQSSTGDRWVMPTEPEAFRAAVQDPSGPDAADAASEHGLTQGRSAIERHLPRDAADPATIRPEAKLVVIYVTDERPDEIEDAGIISDGSSTSPSAAQLAQIQAFMAEYIADFTAEDGVAHLIGIPQGGGGCSSFYEESQGYFQLVDALGGQQGVICDDLGETVDVMIDSIIGDASPIVLSKVPISASIAVARDSLVIHRSREQGWDFRSSSNSIIFYNLPFDPANPSDIVVSYRRWAEQVPID